ncbi:MAG: transpeptidase family protein [Bacteroidales bacterium]|nr:transpeptidase family protein [Bacteroidales bacterium]
MGKTDSNGSYRDRVGILLYVFYLLMLVASVFLIFRLVMIQLDFNPDPEIEKKLTPSSRRVKVEAARGRILSADGRTLAMTYPEYTLFVDCTVQEADVWRDSLDLLCRGIARITGKETAARYKELLTGGRKRGSRYMKLCEGLDITQLYAMEKLPIFNMGQNCGGLIAQTRNRRHYPFGTLGRRTIGFVRDNSEVRNRYVGIEGKFDEALSGTDGEFWTEKTDFGHVQRYDTSFVKACDGLDVHTTIDIDFQLFADKALRRNIEEDPNLEGGCLVVMDVRTGAIRAMVNLLREKTGGPLGEISNLAIGRKGEPGSVFKTSCLMTMLEDGHVKSLQDRIPTNRGVLPGYGYEPDTHITSYEKAHGSSIPIIEGFKVSSNYMFRYLAVKHYGKRPKDYIAKLKSYHLGDAFEFDIEGLAAPALPNPESEMWSRTDLTGAATGYAVDQTPLQILTFYNAIANGGRMMKPYLVDSISGGNRTQKVLGPGVLEKSICSRATADTLVRALKYVVEEGTATRLRGARCQVAGKTGTARVALDSGGYSNRDGQKKYQGTFVGFFPAEDPQYSIICTVYSYFSDKVYFGGTIPAATVREVIDRICDTDPYWRPSIPEAGTVPSMETTVGDRVAEVVNGEVKAPDFQGLGLRDAIALAEAEGLECRHCGTGHVTAQEPAPGTRLKSGETVMIELR